MVPLVGSGLDDFRDFGLGFLLYITEDIVDAHTVVGTIITLHDSVFDLLGMVLFRYD